MAKKISLKKNIEVRARCATCKKSNRKFQKGTMELSVAKNGTVVAKGKHKKCGGNMAVFVGKDKVQGL